MNKEKFKNSPQKTTEELLFKTVFYEPQRKTELWKERIIKECGISEKTFYRWLAGDSIPKLAKEKIAIIMGCHIFDLWPEMQEGGQQ